MAISKISSYQRELRGRSPYSTKFIPDTGGWDTDSEDPADHWTQLDPIAGNYAPNKFNFALIGATDSYVVSSDPGLTNGNYTVRGEVELIDEATSLFIWLGDGVSEEITDAGPFELNVIADFSVRKEIRIGNLWQTGFGDCYIELTSLTSEA